MKSQKLISLAIAMFFCWTTFSQRDTIKKNRPPIQIMRHCYSYSAEPENPLFVLNGKIVNSKKVRKLNQETIESISVLKDSAAINTYGSKGKYGVIIIKTKKLSKREVRKLKKKHS